MRRPKGREEPRGGRAKKHQPRGEERRKPSDPFEMEERKVVTARLLGLGMTPSQVRNALQSEHGLSASQADTSIRQVFQDIQAEYTAYKPYAKAAQADRLHRLIAICNAKQQYGEAIRAEALLAKIDGTVDPVVVKVDHEMVVRESLVALVANLSPEDRDRMVAEQLQLEAAAEAARVHGVLPHTNGVAR